MTTRSPASRHWRSDGSEPLPSGPAHRVRPLRQGAHGQREPRPTWRDRRLRDILARMRHDGCGGLAAKAELLTGIEGVSSRPVRRIVLLG